MPKRSISDAEIGLIKAMLARGMKNRDIQFYFNRQDRPVNSGRITQIRGNSYGPEVPSATSAELNAFLKTFKAAQVGVVVQAPAQKAEPTVADHAMALFEQGADGVWRLRLGETDQHECKKDFDAKKLWPVLRAIAALSNNKGGFVFLGVSNAQCCVEGVCADFEAFDIAKITNRAKHYLSPTPRIETKGTIDLGGKKVGFIHVAAHPDKPVIVCRDGESLNEGEILFRYAGQSSRIKFGDLRDMLAERDRRSQMALATAAGKIATVGTAKALILDTDKNILDADGREVLIDEELVRSINFIREGQFDEIDGDPTLKLVGEVKAVSVQSLAAGKPVPKAISQEDILSVFLNQEVAGQPTEFVLAGVSQPRLWLPIFFFTSLSQKTPEQMAAEVAHITTSQKGKKKNAIDRLTSKKSAFTKTLTQKARTVASQIETGTLTIPTDAHEVSTFAQGLCGVKATKLDLFDILGALVECQKLAQAADDGNAIGAVFKAACRVDEMFFRP